MMKIYLIRHGESQNNKKDVLSGIQDIPLTQVGVEQSKKLAVFFKGKTIDKVITSPLQRAKHTGALIFPQHQKHGVIYKHKGLIELNYGIYEGFERSKYHKTTDPVIEKWETCPSTIVFPKGDSILEHSEYVFNTIKDIAESHQNKTIAIVSHKSTIRLILAKILGLHIDYFRNIPCDNCSIHSISYKNNQLTIDFINLTI